MKQFFKFMFASMLGVFLSLVIFIFIMVAIISAFASSATSEGKTMIEKGTILHIYFKSPIKDRGTDNPFEDFDFFSFTSGSQPGLNEILKNIEKASRDSKIDGIYLDLSGLQAGFAAVSEIRNALLEYKKSSKFIYAYSDYYTQGSYYLASAADEVWVNPEGVVEFKGLSAQIPFFRQMFEKLEIEPQVIRHGKFKSAIEPLILDKMSDENREQVATYMNGLWKHYLAEVSNSRKIPTERLQQIADSMLIQNAHDALAQKMIDKIGYKDEFLELLKKKSGKSTGDDLDFVSMKKYNHTNDPGPEKEFTRDRIAVIYASGNIVSGKGDDDEIGSETLSETIRKARENDKIKAVVLRVNSPGGDALASEVIWREVDMCSKQKPVIVSMGDLAASGGYYISCAADTIVAQPTTITGSIGVFGVILNAKNLMNNKLGITFDGYQTARYADMGTPFRPLTEAEKMIIQNSVEQVYKTFTTRVSDGRGIPVDVVDSIGQGRVWTGTDAKRLGLVDVMGGLDDAIAIAAKKAKLDNYRIVELPEEKEPFTQIVEEISGDAEVKWMKNKLGESYKLYEAGERLKKMQGVQAFSFYNFGFE